MAVAAGRGAGEAINDGSFWMSLTAFVSYFDRLDVLHLHDAESDDGSRRHTCHAAGVLEGRDALLRLTARGDGGGGGGAVECRVAVHQPRVEMKHRYAWRVVVVDPRDMRVVAGAGDPFTYECAVASESFAAEIGVEYIVVVDGHPSRKKCLPLDFSVVVSATTPDVEVSADGRWCHKFPDGPEMRTVLKDPVGWERIKRFVD